MDPSRRLTPAAAACHGCPPRGESGTWRQATYPEEPVMADKSPRQHQSKTAGKSIKEKRADKRAAAGDSGNTSVVPPRSPKH